ncbi:MAG: hypothetical protein ACRDSP_14160 [Pseudonocardiaceae bacterium]
MTGEPPDQLGAYTLRMALVINAAAGLVLAGALVPQLSAPLSLAAAVMWPPSRRGSDPVFLVEGTVEGTMVEALRRIQTAASRRF